MNRCFLILATLATLAILCNAKCSGPAKSSSSQSEAIKDPFKPPPCDSVLCNKYTDDKLIDLIKKVEKKCHCDCGCNKKLFCSLSAFCEAYRNYDPKTYGVLQCVINKLSNPCYSSYYNAFLNIIFKGCGCNKKNFNIYTFFYDLCYGCNGCLDYCYIQCGQTIWYAKAAGAPSAEAARAPAAAGAPAMASQMFSSAS